MGRVLAIEGLRGLSHALELAATIALMCDPHDIGRAIEDAATGQEGAHEAFSATAYLYDHVPGGVGLAARIFERSPELVGRAAELVAACRCLAGCPSCVGATVASAEAAHLHDPSFV